MPDGAGVIVRFDDPRLGKEAVVGSVRISAANPAISASAVVRNGADVHVALPESSDYFARGLLASGECLRAYAHCGRAGQPVHLPIVVDEDAPRPALPGPGFRGSTWAAGYRWDGHAGQYVPTGGAAIAAMAEGPHVTVEDNSDANLVQFSQDGRPPCCIACLPGEAILADKEHIAPAEQLAATLLAFLHLGDGEMTEPVAREALKVADSADVAAVPAILDLAIAYHTLYASGEPDAVRVGRFAERYKNSADAHVIIAWTHLRAKPPRFDAAARLLEEAVHCGLPAVTQGLQLLVDGLNTIPDDESAAIATITPYAASARISEIMTTFWGADPNHPRPSPILAHAPAHAITADAADRARKHGPIAEAAAAAWPNRAGGLSAALELVRAELNVALGLASELALASRPEAVHALARALGWGAPKFLDMSPA
jgi:hypothetical protein